MIENVKSQMCKLSVELLKQLKNNYSLKFQDFKVNFSS